MSTSSSVIPAIAVCVAPRDIEVEPTVTALFVSFAFAIDPANIAFVTDVFASVNAPEFVTVAPLDIAE